MAYAVCLGGGGRGEMMQYIHTEVYINYIHVCTVCVMMYCKPYTLQSMHPISNTQGWSHANMQLTDLLWSYQECFDPYMLANSLSVCSSRVTLSGWQPSAARWSRVIESGCL